MTTTDSTNPEQSLAHDQGVYSAFNTIHELVTMDGMDMDFLHTVLDGIILIMSADNPQIMVPFQPEKEERRLKELENLRKLIAQRGGQ